MVQASQAAGFYYAISQKYIYTQEFFDSFVENIQFYKLFKDLKMVIKTTAYIYVRSSYYRLGGLGFACILN